MSLMGKLRSRLCTRLLGPPGHLQQVTVVLIILFDEQACVSRRTHLSPLVIPSLRQLELTDDSAVLKVEGLRMPS